MKKHYGVKSKFTLIELLVVILIIGILASMLVGALHTSIETARSADCIACLRKMVIDVASAYANDHRSVVYAADGGDGEGGEPEWVEAMSDMGYMNPITTTTYDDKYHCGAWTGGIRNDSNGNRILTATYGQRVGGNGMGYSEPGWRVPNHDSGVDDENVGDSWYSFNSNKIVDVNINHSELVVGLSSFVLYADTSSEGTGGWAQHYLLSAYMGNPDNYDPPLFSHVPLADYKNRKAHFRHPGEKCNMGFMDGHAKGIKHDYEGYNDESTYKYGISKGIHDLVQHP